MLRLIALLFFFGAGVAHAQQGGITSAREYYGQCREALEQNKPCEALAACKAGLQAKELEILVELTRKAQTQCDAQRAERKKKVCPEGQAITEDTDGHCCWQGQVWNGAQCVGQPISCPDGLEINRMQQTCAQTCGEPGEGRIIIDNEDHCCWPGQGWSRSQDRCIGLPECPERYTVEAEVCREIIDDKDGDGVADDQDLCPGMQESPDDPGDNKDGCPNPDQDGDGVCEAWVFTQNLTDTFTQCAITTDMCPNQPEDLDDFEDSDGCPDLDDDGDGVPDTEDACRLEPEDFDTYEDGDGCPEETAEELAQVMFAQAEAERLETMALAGWISLGVGAALVTTGVVLHLVAEDMRDDVRNSDSDGVVRSARQVEVEDIEARANALSLTGVGGIALGSVALLSSAALLLYAEYTATDEEAPAVSFSVGREHIFLNILTRF